jgi:hypothetical protein
MAFRLRTIWLQFFAGIVLGVSALLMFLPWHPPVGIYIGILAFLGVCVPLIRGDRISPHEKTAWTAVMLILVLLEITSIIKEQHEHDNQQAEDRETQLEGFKKIGQGITDAINRSDRNFSAVMGRTDAAIGRTDEVLRNVTGGTSCPYFVPYLSVSSIDGTVQVNGKYTLRELIMTVDDFTEAIDRYKHFDDPGYRFNSYLTQFSWPSLPPRRAMKIPFPIPFSGTGKRHIYMVQFSALNGIWEEELMLKKDKFAIWRAAYRVYSEDQPHKICVKPWIEPNFPRLSNNEPDWR